MIWLLLFFVQYYIVQLWVATWIPNYDPMKDYISELGDTKKSPICMWMNWSFMLNGLLLTLTALFLNVDLLSRLCLIASASGAILVGLNPENHDFNLHITGAILSFVFGNLSLWSLWFSLGSAVCLVGALVGTLGAPFYIWGDQNNGLYERLVSYPQTLALITLGITGL